MGKGDKLASGGHTATWGPMDASAAKWESIFGAPEKPKKAKKSRNRKRPAQRTEESKG